MKISFPLHNGTFQFDGTFEEFEKLLDTKLAIDDVGEAIDELKAEIERTVKNYAEKDCPDLSELIATKVGKSL